ncbi:unnamed protein product [Calypogeia fissa]
MNWIEDLGPSRPPLIASRRMPSTITPAELDSIFESLQVDGANANIDLQTLCRCLYALAKMEAEKASECQESEEFREFYRELFSFIEVYLTECPCLKRSPRDTEVILYCLGILVDLSKFLLLRIEDSTSSKRICDCIFVIRTLCRALDREIPFHQQHEYKGLPTGLLEEGPRRYVSYSHYGESDVCENPAKRRRSSMSVDRSSCRCSDCGTLEPNLWIKCLVEHFGRACPGYSGETRGFDILKKLLPILHEFPVELTEVVLHLFATTTETLRDDLRSNLITSFVEFYGKLVQRCGHELNQSSIEIFVIIVKHLKCCLRFLLPVEIAKHLVTDLHNLIQETVLEAIAVESESGITPGEVQEDSVFGEKLRLTYPAAFSLNSVISHGVSWIKAALNGKSTNKTSM